MRLVWIIIPLILFSIIGMQDSFDYGGGGGGGKAPDPRVCGDRLCSEIPGGRDAWENKEPVPITIKNEPLMLSPKQQMKTGILPTEVECKADLELIFKSSGAPACVKSSTAEKLVQRGWTINEESRSKFNPRDIEVMDR